MRQWLRSYWWLIAGVVCLVLGALAAEHVSTIVVAAWSLPRIHVGYALLAAGCALGLVLAYATAWWLLVGALERRRSSYLATVRLFALAWPGRYVPASIPFYSGRMLGGQRLGLSRGAIAASLVYENIFVIAATGSTSMLMLVVGSRERFHGGPWLVLAALAIAASSAVLHPAVMRWIVERLAVRVRRLGALHQYVLPGAVVAQVAAAYAVGSVFAGSIFYFSLLAVGSNEHPPLLLALAAYNIAGIAGMLALAVPGGVGVREGVAVAIMGVLVSPPVALSAAVLARGLALIADLALPALLMLLTFGARAAGRRATPKRPLAERHAA